MTTSSFRDPNTAHAIVWFKRDLRVADHAPLAEAAALGPVIPLYVIEPDYWQLPDVSARHWRFLRASLEDLNTDLMQRGQSLIIRTGRVVDILADLARHLRIDSLWSHEETGNNWTYQRDRAVMAWCRAEGVPWREIAQHGVIRRLPTRNGWARKWAHQMKAPVVKAPQGLKAAARGITSEPLPDVPFAGAFANAPAFTDEQPGGRAAGTLFLKSFLEKRGRPYRAAMASPAKGRVACSRLSPYLSYGCLSMREVTHASDKRAAEAQAKSERMWAHSMKSFGSRLHWHCHFIQKLEDEPRLEFRNLHPAYNDLRPDEKTMGERDHARLAAWQRGETGLPFVDACMRMLNTTGWMNFRMRAMLMAVASYHLWLDWRLPGEHLARQFTDYEPGIHWPQVQMQSGTTGINTIRIYNPVKQGHDQDPDGTFIRRWLPELAEVPDIFIHEPWKWPDAREVLEDRYPAPIVDYLAAARQARERVWALRKSTPFARKAQLIQNRHGSRKSGIPFRGSGAKDQDQAVIQSPRRRGPKPGDAQLALDL
ncbi:MAG: deoxyribodipyrimidine photo-lyase [Pseudomonadota bacterium]